MAKEKNNKNKKVKVKNENLPTHERMKHGHFTIRENIAQLDEPLRIDKLFRNGIIDEMHHIYGMQIITLWTIANRSNIKTMRYERMYFAPSDANHAALNKMSAEDQFYKTMRGMNSRERDLVYKICIEEKGAIEAGRALGLPVNNITVYVRAAFDALGNALANMREIRKEQETSLATQKEETEEMA